MAIPTLTYSLGANGLVLPTQQQILAYLQAQFFAIYGVDLTTQDPSTPDNQWVNILVQMVLDVQDIDVQTYTSFDPDQALGTVLDQRVAINGIQRNNGTYSTTNVNITISTSTPITLYGLDQTAQQVYTVQDSSGNQWQLQFTQNSVSSGTYTYAFQAASPGAILVTPDTITLPYTVVLGVTLINNPGAQTYIGVNEETDAALKIRRQQSVAISSQGYLDGLLAALLDIDGVTYANVIENTTGSTFNGSGTPAANIPANIGLAGHSIWVIVAAANESSSTTQEEIANAIYTKRNAGCGMRGSESYTVTRPSGNQVTLYWDWVVPTPIFVEFYALSINGTSLPNVSAIQNGVTQNGNVITPSLASLFLPAPSQTVNSNSVSTYVQEIDPNTFVQGTGFSSGAVQVAYFSGVPASGHFYFTYNGVASSQVSYNSSASTIQGYLRTLTGSSSLLVTGSLASQTLTIQMLGISDPLLLGIQAGTNTLQTSAPAAITINLLSDTNFIQTISFSAVAASGSFYLTYNGNSTVSIAYNASAATIQSDLQSVSGLSSVTVSGSIASQTLEITMVGVVSPNLLSVTTNTLEDASSNPIQTSVQRYYPSVLPVSSSLQQYELTPVNTIILSSSGYMFLTAPNAVYSIVNGVVTWPATLAITHATSTTFVGYGGHGSYTYSVVTSTGSVINAASGVYVAGTAGTDTVQVQDSLGNVATVTVTIS